MSRCKKCQVYIKDNTEVCPLCKCVIEHSGEKEDMYPDISSKNRIFALLTRIYLFVAIFAETILIYVNYRYFSGTWWSVIPAGVLLYIYVTLKYTAGNSHSGYMIKIFVAFLFAAGILTMIDYGMGAVGWAMDYCMPGFLIILDIVIGVLMIANHRRWFSYIIWQLLVIVLSVAQLIFVALGYIKHPALVHWSIFIAVFFFLGTVIIGGRFSTGELKRRFHI